MTPERWERVKALFLSALEHPAGERTAFLAAACDDDASVRAEVELLLRSHDHAGSFMDEPVVHALRGAVATETPPTGSLSRDRAVPTLSSPKSGSNIEAPRTFLPDDVVADRYKIVRYIAQGGMGEVYEVEDLSLGGHLALKTIRPEIAEDSRVIVRFKREIHVARKVTHPNVCRIYDLGTHRAPPREGSTVPREILFLTMELLVGETLSDRIAEVTRLTTDDALTLVEQMTAGLAAAHAAGVLHRDFKSGNVMLLPPEDPRCGTRAVITDFGMARGFASKDSLVSISDSGVIGGTLLYMAPEQVQGLELTPAADIYALGVVMYEMVTGVRPFEGDSPITAAVKRLTEPPPTPRLHVPDIDPAWESVILRCLAREPAGRFANAMDVVAALRGQAMPPHVGVPSASPPAVPSREAPRAPAPNVRAPLKRYTAWVAGALLAIAGGYYTWRARPAGGGRPGIQERLGARRRRVALHGRLRDTDHGLRDRGHASRYPGPGGDASQDRAGYRRCRVPHEGPRDTAQAEPWRGRRRARLVHGPRCGRGPAPADRPAAVQRSEPRPSHHVDGHRH
jgi:serine/threonine protein kinase